MKETSTSQVVLEMESNIDNSKAVARYDLLADLFVYPTTLFPGKIKQVQEYLNQYYPKAGKKLKPFTDYTLKATLNELEELFTRSFDVQSVTTLDLGYVMFGDDYKRAEILVNLNREHKEVDNDCNNELADHLPNVLRLIYKMKDRQLARELVEKIIGPSVFKMKAEFDPEKVEEKTKVYLKHHKTVIQMSKKYGTLYQCTLEALYDVLKKDFEISEKEQLPQTSDFLKSIETEIRLEQ